MVHRRLAVIDLETGDQPLYEPGGAALIEAELGVDREREESSLLAIDQSSEGRFATWELTRGPGRPLELFIKGELRQDLITERGARSELDLVALAPGVRFNLPRRGRAGAELGADWLAAPRGSVPISLRAGREVGITWRLRLNADYALSESVTLSADYQGAVEPESGIHNRGSVRVSAFF